MAVRKARFAPTVVPEVARPTRRTYRALTDFYVTLGETHLAFHKGRRFTTDEIPFDPAVMEPLD